MKALLVLLLLASSARAQDRIERRRDASPAPAQPAQSQPSAAPSAVERVRIVPGTPPAQPAPQYPRRYQGDPYWGSPYPYHQLWYGDRWWWRHPYDQHWHYWDDDRWHAAPPSADVPPASAAPTPAPGGAWKSPDGTRLVQVAGPTSDAFLYDVEGSSGAARYVKRLASDVESARFSGGRDGAPLRILLVLREGGFALFDRNGKPVDAR